MVTDVVRDVKVDALRAQLPAVQTTGYFNAGATGPLPTVAIEAAETAARRELDQGRIVPGASVTNRERNRRFAAFAAELFGAHSDEIALTHSASEGLNTALLGIAWQRGDEVVSTSEEHPGLLLPLALLARRHGVVTRFANIGDGGAGVVDAIASKITARTRVIALSHVLWSTGSVLPLREVVTLARERGLMVVVDGAQSAGQVPVNLHDLGVDAYAIAGQKWLCGPEGTGFLYVRRDRFADIAPTSVRYGQFDASGYFMPAPGAMRYEMGEFYRPAIAAQEAALWWLHEDVGIDWAHRRIAQLGADLRDRLMVAEGVTVITPPASMAGLVNFSVDDMTPQEVADRLYQRGYTIRYVVSSPCTTCARASVGWWNTEEEIAGLATEIGDLARSV